MGKPQITFCNNYLIYKGSPNFIKEEERHDGTISWPQKLHALPYRRLIGMPSYKLSCLGIRIIMQKESRMSQCPPDSPAVSKKYADKGNRQKRGLCVHNGNIYNADSVGAYNILRKHIMTGEQVFATIVGAGAGMVFYGITDSFIDTRSILGINHKDLLGIRVEYM